jgi:hypothetical protein
MFWQPVFFILLLPLIVVEIVVFIKTRRLSWLIYALAIFTYVIAVNYTIDVFDLGRNAVILMLFASAALMALVGRRLRKDASLDTPAARSVAIALAAIMLVAIVVSVLFGKGVEELRPVPSVRSTDVISFYNEQGVDKMPYQDRQVTLADRVITNGFFLPVPARERVFRACLVTTAGAQELGFQQEYDTYPEAPPLGVLTMHARFSPARLPVGEVPKEVHVFELLPVSANEGRPYTPCTAEPDEEPLFRIPVAQ